MSSEDEISSNLNRMLEELSKHMDEIERETSSQIDPIPGPDNLAEEKYWELSENLITEHRFKWIYNHFGLKYIDYTTEIFYRVTMPVAVFIIMCAWLIFVGVVVILVGLKNVEFDLDYRVMITLLGSTTVTVFGLFPNILRHYFPKGQNENNKDK